jgi:predicted nucleotidyltransferase
MATPTFADFPKIDLDKPVPMEAIQMVVNRIAEEFKPEKIILFGSHAYGTPKPWSDVDLLVVMNTKLSAREQKRVIYEALRNRPFSIDLIVRTPAELERRIGGRDYFLREVVNKGKALYERTHK